jgi:integrase/recombinase XerD
LAQRAAARDSGQITVFGKNGRTRSIALTAPLWAELTGVRGNAGAEQPVFPSRSGKLLDHGRVRIIVRRAAKQAGVVDAVSAHWLRHALDHGAPIHLVQATLGHSSVPHARQVTRYNVSAHGFESGSEANVYAVAGSITLPI